MATAQEKATPCCAAGEDSNAAPVPSSVAAAFISAVDSIPDPPPKTVSAKGSYFFYILVHLFVIYFWLNLF